MPAADLLTRLSPEQASALWARQEALQAEASEVLAQLDLLACASRLGVAWRGRALLPSAGDRRRRPPP